MVRIPIATSMKNVEKPVTLIVFNIENNFAGFTSLSVFFLLPKWVSIIINEKTEPIAVASPAPIIPIFKIKTKK